jgi:hypothetical protein
MKNKMQKAVCGVVAVVGMAMLVTVAGCATLDRAYNAEVTWRDEAVVKVVTNTVVVTNLVPQVVAEVGKPAVTNFVTVLVTNTIPVFETNVVQVPVTNLVAKPAAVATIDATGSLVNIFLPGIGSMVALLLGGVYHGYRQLRNRKVNEALVQGVETARAILETTPQGQAVDTQFVKWLMEHQKQAGVFQTVSTLVDAFTDNPAAKLTAQEIAERVKKAQTAGSV